VRVEDVNAREDGLRVRVARIHKSALLPILELKLMEPEATGQFRARLRATGFRNAPAVSCHAVDDLDRRDKLVAIRAATVMRFGNCARDRLGKGLAGEEGEGGVDSVHVHIITAKPVNGSAKS